MKKIIPLFTMVGLLLLISCSSKVEKESKGYSDPKIDKIAQEKFPDGYFLIPNEDQSFILCVKKSQKNLKIPESNVEFFVFNKKEGKNVLEKKIDLANVTWHDKTHLKISLSKGTIEENYNPNKYIYYLDVVTGEKIKELPTNKLDE